MEYIRKIYGVPAKRGNRLTLTLDSTRKYSGVIVGSKGKYLRVRFDHMKTISSIHPTWNVEYL